MLRFMTVEDAAGEATLRQPFGELGEAGDVHEEDRRGEALGGGRSQRRGVRGDAARNPRGDVTGECVEKCG